MMNESKKNITIYDIAKEAKVSPATVSRVLSDSGYGVRPLLRKRVEEAADLLGYMPNMIGRQLKKKITTNIGVILPSISNPFYPKLLLGIEEVARQAGKQVLLCNSGRSADVEKGYLQTLYENQVKGIIVSSISDDYSMFSEIQERGVSLVALDQKMENFDCQQILFDYERAGFMAAEYLLKKGHRKIGFISAPLDRFSRKSVFDGFCSAMLQYQIDLPEEYILISTNEYESIENSYEFENGRNLTEKLMNLQNPPTAIFACNDMTALGVYKQLNEMGLKIPDDVSVMGLDDIEVSSMISPGLTTIHQPNYEMGKIACKILLEVLDGEFNEVDILLQPKLIERGSIKEIDVGRKLHGTKMGWKALGYR